MSNTTKTESTILSVQDAGRLGARLAKALGLDHTTRLVLEFEVGKPLRYTAEGWAIDSAEIGDAMTVLGDEFAKYNGKA